MTAEGPTPRLETFSYLPPPSADGIAALVGYLLRAGCVPAIEHTERPGPRQVYWEMWKLPLFEARSSAEVLGEIEACATAHPRSYVRLIGYDPRRQGQVLSVVVRRP